MTATHLNIIIACFVIVLLIITTLVIYTPDQNINQYKKVRYTLLALCFIPVFLGLWAVYDDYQITTGKKEEAQLLISRIDQLEQKLQQFNTHNTQNLSADELQNTIKARLQITKELEDTKAKLHLILR